MPQDYLFATYFLTITNSLRNFHFHRDTKEVTKPVIKVHEILQASAKDFNGIEYP